MSGSGEGEGHYAFHPISGSMVHLSNGNRTGERLMAKSDFNNGLVFSHTPLDTNVIFQVRLEKKVQKLTKN